MNNICATVHVQCTCKTHNILYIKRHTCIKCLLGTTDNTLNDLLHGSYSVFSKGQVSIDLLICINKLVFLSVRPMPPMPFILLFVTNISQCN